MTSSLTWSDLNLTPSERAALEPFAVNEPEAVVSLAKGSPELLERVLKPTTVTRLQGVDVRLPQVSMATFALGASMKKVEVALPKGGRTFETKRADLLQKLSEATSDAARKDVSAKLQRLYSRSPTASRKVATPVRSAKG